MIRDLLPSYVLTLDSFISLIIVIIDLVTVENFPLYKFVINSPKTK